MRKIKLVHNWLFIVHPVRAMISGFVLSILLSVSYLLIVDQEDFFFTFNRYKLLILVSGIGTAFYVYLWARRHKKS